MNLNTDNIDFKPVTDPSKESGTRPLYTDGKLYWYLDSKADELPREIIQDIVNGIVHQHDLLDLDKMYHNLVYPNPKSIELPIRICYDAYSIMCSKYDDPEKQAALEKEREYFVKVEKNESGLKIPSFKSCSEIFLTAEDCEKYLKEAFENGKDTSGIYFVKSHWSEGYYRDFYKDISTGKYYTEFNETNYVTPIPMDIKF